MNTTPSTPKGPEAVSYTVVGGYGAKSASEARWPVSVLILGRPGRFQRRDLIEQASRLGFAETVCVEQGSGGYDVEQLCREFPRLRVMLVPETKNTGILVNIGIAEARMKFVLVLYSDMSILPFLDRRLEEVFEEKTLCVVPLIRAPRGDVLPTLSMPVEDKGRLRVIPLLPAQDYQASLYPFDYVGIYERDKFLRLGGFDEAIRNGFWQKMDFGYRAWLWGEVIKCRSDIRLQSGLDPESEDQTPDDDYARFYLKNMLPRFLGDHSDLPLSRFASFSRVSRNGFFRDLRDFARVRAWVSANAWRFKRDARYIAELWDTGGGV